MTDPVPTLDLKNIKGSIREFERWMAASKKDLQDFAAAYAEWKR